MHSLTSTPIKSFPFTTFLHLHSLVAVKSQDKTSHRNHRKLIHFRSRWSDSVNPLRIVFRGSCSTGVVVIVGDKHPLKSLCRCDLIVALDVGTISLLLRTWSTVHYNKGPPDAIQYRTIMRVMSKGHQITQSPHRIDFNEFHLTHTRSVQVAIFLVRSLSSVGLYWTWSGIWGTSETIRRGSKLFARADLSWATARVVGTEMSVWLTWEKSRVAVSSVV